MLFLKLLFCALISYLLGSLNAGIIITKLFKGIDIRTQGSGNAGLTNAYRVLGAGPSALVIAGDVVKGVISMLLSGWILGEYGYACAFIFTILGHIYPLYYEFKGGKAVLTTAAMLAVFDWRALVILLSLFLLIVFATKYVSLGSVVGISLMPPVTYLFAPGETLFLMCTLFVAFWVVILHKENIIRLKNGTENKFKRKQ